MADVATAPAPSTTAPPAPPASPPPGAPAAAGSPDPYKDAQAQTDANARATLRALSTAGTAGTAQYAQAQQAMQGDKGQAIQNLLGSAMFKSIPGQSVGTPAGVSPAPGVVGQAFDQRLASTGLLGDAFNAAMGTREAGAGRYFDEAKGAIPVIQAQTNQRIEVARERAQQAHDAAQARAQQAAQSFAMSMALKQMGLDAATARAAKANAPQTLGQFLAANGGPDLVGDQLAAGLNARGGMSGPDQQIGQVGGGHPGAGVNPVAGADTVLPTMLNGTPISPDVALTLMGNSQRTDQTQNKPGTIPTGAERLAQLQNGPAYTNDRNLIPNVQTALTQVGMTQTIQRVMATHPGMSYEDAQLITQDAYNQLPKASQAKVK